MIHQKQGPGIEFSQPPDMKKIHSHLKSWYLYLPKTQTNPEITEKRTMLDVLDIFLLLIWCFIFEAIGNS